MSAQIHSQDEQHLKQLEMSWDNAVARRDAAALADLVTDDYEVTDVNGHIHNKATVLHAVASADPNLKPYRRDNVNVRIDGNTAVVSGRITWANHNGAGNQNSNGNGHGQTRAQYLKLYVKRDGAWKALVARAIRITDAENSMGPERTVERATNGNSTFCGWINANLEDGPLLEFLGVKLGTYDELFGGFEECRASEEIIHRLRPYWGRFVWHFKPLDVFIPSQRAA
jgi:ketosteroid isomerase-like protein